MDRRDGYIHHIIEVFVYVFVDSSDISLKLIRRNGGLTQDELYTTQITVVVPREIFGEFYIIVQTDVYNAVFEHTAEDNNIGVSVSDHCILISYNFVWVLFIIQTKRQQSNFNFPFLVFYLNTMPIYFSPQRSC